MAEYPNDYISRQQLIEYANNSRVGIDAIDIARFPAADVRENVRGKWIRKSPTAWNWTCSCCKKDDKYAYSAGESFDPDVLQDFFCPNCGADMRGKKDG